MHVWCSIHYCKDQKTSDHNGLKTWLSIYPCLLSVKNFNAFIISFYQSSPSFPRKCMCVHTDCSVICLYCCTHISPENKETNESNLKCFQQPLYADKYPAQYFRSLVTEKNPQVTFPASLHFSSCCCPTWKLKVTAGIPLYLASAPTGVFNGLESSLFPPTSPTYIDAPLPHPPFKTKTAA